MKPYLARVKKLPKVSTPYPFKTKDTVCILGEIQRMPGHVVVALQDGKVLFGWHKDNFRRLTKAEL